MTPLRQLADAGRHAGRPLQASGVGADLRVRPNVTLFKPQIAYRLRRDNWTDTPLPPEFPAGQQSAGRRDHRLRTSTARTAVR